MKNQNDLAKTFSGRPSEECWIGDWDFADPWSKGRMAKKRMDGFTLAELNEFTKDWWNNQTLVPNPSVHVLHTRVFLPDGEDQGEDNG